MVGAGAAGIAALSAKRKKIVNLLLVTVLLAACRETPSLDNPEQLTDGVCQQTAKLPRPAFIVNGHQTPDSWPVPAAQQQAIGALMEYLPQLDTFTNICTATLITPTIALTAAHCLAPAYSWQPPKDIASFRLAFGPDVGNVKERILLPLAAFEYHPLYSAQNSDVSQNDIALIFLDETVSVAISDIEPLAVNSTDITPLEGQQVQNCGYGITTVTAGEEASNTKRNWLSEEISAVNDYSFTVDGHGLGGVCSGDSGGPALYRFPDGEVRIIGVISYGDESCNGQDVFARTDYNYAWLQKMAGLVPDCEIIGWQGTCTDNIAKWCSGGRLLSRDCNECGETCLKTAELGNYCHNNI